MTPISLSPPRAPAQVLALILLATAAGCGGSSAGQATSLSTGASAQAGQTGGQANGTVDPQQQAKIVLGRKLFFEERLSVPSGMACGTCHDPFRGWGDERPQGKGVQDNTLHNLMVAGNYYKTVSLGRNTPTIYNSFIFPNQFWDGRAGDLAHQANFPVEAVQEMNSKWATHVLPLLNASDAYVALFQAAFPNQPISQLNAVTAMGEFEKSIAVFDTPYDLYLAGDTNALSPQAEHGMQLFFGSAGCGQCHPAPQLTTMEFLNTGVPNAGINLLLGQTDFGFGKRLDLTQNPPVQHDDPQDYSKFKVPHLRMVSVTHPFMHNGALETLEAVVEFYDQGGGPDPSGTGTKDPRIVPLGLSMQDKADLVAFLRDGLTGTEIK